MMSWPLLASHKSELVARRIGCLELPSSPSLRRLPFIGFAQIVPLPVVGEGYGILPRLIGEAHGTVGVAGRAFGTLPSHNDEALATSASPVVGLESFRRSKARRMARSRSG
jgi:hypothetical protein